LTNASFEPSVPKRNIYAVLTQADAFVATLRRSRLYQHGMSMNKVFDYMAVGRPIIFSADSANDPVSEAGAGLKVPPEDPQAMAKAVLDLASRSVDDRNEMGRRGRAVVRRRYNCAVLTERLEEVLTSVALPASAVRARPPSGTG
jgi:glycosyltransferase involved in cell wall biosynthesis